MSASSHQEEPVTALVVRLIGEWERSGRKLKDLAERGGFAAPSMVSQVKLGTSAVTNFTGPKFARAFGLTYPELVARAYSEAAGHGVHKRSPDELLEVASATIAELREEIRSAPWQAAPRTEAPAAATKRARKAARYHGRVQAARDEKDALRAAQDAEAAKKEKAHRRRGVA